MIMLEFGSQSGKKVWRTGSLFQILGTFRYGNVTRLYTFIGLLDQITYQLINHFDRREGALQIPGSSKAVSGNFDSSSIYWLCVLSTSCCIYVSNELDATSTRGKAAGRRSLSPRQVSPALMGIVNRAERTKK